MGQRWSARDIPDLSGKTALVTGANAGLGWEITRLLTGRGARVLMACRNEQKADHAAGEIRKRSPEGKIDFVSLDLASLASIDAAAESVRKEESALHMLINNAGLMAVDRGSTEDGFEMQFGVNHLGHFALTAGLMPLLLKTPGSRVVTMSSQGHRGGRMHFDDLMYDRRPYQRWMAYSQSKLANLLFAFELQRRLGDGAPTQSLAAHPGMSNTDLGYEGSGASNQFLRIAVPIFTQPAAVGALPAIRAATDASASGGEFYGPRFMVAGLPVREKPSRRARSVEDARELWDISAQLTSRTIEIVTPTG